jgi:serine/threonine protein kinase
MTRDRWQRLRDALYGALELAPDRRASFLDQVCSNDHALRRDVEALLSSNDEARSTFLEAGAPVGLMNGTKLGDYEVRSLIGSGGMGEVYRAHDLRLDRDVAIKVLPSSLSSDPERLRRFEREARAAAALNHPNILAVFQLGTYNGAPYLVSELLEGETLRARIERSPLPLPLAIDYCVQIARGLAAAHDKGIVHRDLKPENLFITMDGRIKILDFGLAKLVQPDAGTAKTHLLDQTQPGVVMGTFGYMSPEQVRAGTVDHRSDIFAFGAILYELLTGKRAFQGPTAVEMMNVILKEDPPGVSTISPSVPRPLERIVHRCLEKNPEQRFRSASDLAFALEASPSEAPSADSVVTKARWPRVRPAWILILAIAVVLVIAAVALWRMQGGGSRAEGVGQHAESPQEQSVPLPTPEHPESGPSTESPVSKPVMATFSTDRDHPTRLRSSELRGAGMAGKRVRYYFSFLGGPGELKVTFDFNSEGGARAGYATLFDQDFTMIDKLGTVLNRGESDRKVKHIELDQQKSIIVEIDIEGSDPASTFLLRVEGAARFQ